MGEILFTKITTQLRDSIKSTVNVMHSKVAKLCEEKVKSKEMQRNIPCERENW